MTPPLLIGLVSFAFTLAAILVQGGRVLQRADQVEQAAKDAKELREREAAALVEALAAMRQRDHDLAAISAAHANDIANLKEANQRTTLDTADHRQRVDATLREILALAGQSTERLIRIEARLDTPPPPPRPR